METFYFPFCTYTILPSGQIDRKKTALSEKKIGFIFSRGVQKVESIMISSAVNQFPCKLLHIATLEQTNDIANWRWLLKGANVFNVQSIFV